MTPAAHGGDMGTLLAVFAHPDDEAYVAGGLMALAADAGRRVVCVTATRGELGFPDDDRRPLEERAAQREAELAACLAILGVREHHWLDQPDGGCANVPEEAPIARLCELLEDVRPDTVLTFGPDGQTYHPDHMTVSRWTTAAVRRCAPAPDLLYATMTTEWAEMLSAYVPFEYVTMVPGAEPVTVAEDEVDVCFRLDDALLDRKVQALRCQVSQVAPLIAMMGADAYRMMNRDETYCRPTAVDWAS